jgi:integrase
MATQIKLDSKTARLKLKPRKKPYTNRIAAGIRLAYRRNAKVAGTWSVLGGGGTWLKRIGIADDLEPADGYNILDFWQARARSLDLARAKDDPDSGKPVTVDAALTDYAADLAARGSRAYNAERARIHLPKALAGKTVALLTARELSRWRDGMLTKLAPASVGRIARMLKAALTRAANHDARITNRDAWRVGLAGLADGEGGTRNVIIGDDQVRSIIAAAPAEGPEFALLVEVAAVTGARPVQIARLQVGDVQADRSDPRLMMPTSAKGRRKVIGRRPVPISADLAFRLRQFAAGRPASALLFPYSDGKGWRGTRHYRPFQRTVERAGLDRKVTIYSLRHSSVTRSLLASVPIRIVAVAHDTSVAMIERTYSKSIADHADAVTRAAMLEVEQPVAAKIIPLKG